MTSWPDMGAMSNNWPERGRDGGLIFVRKFPPLMGQIVGRRSDLGASELGRHRGARTHSFNQVAIVLELSFLVVAVVIIIIRLHRGANKANMLAMLTMVLAESVSTRPPKWQDPGQLGLANS